MVAKKEALTVVVPCFNEAGGVASTVASVLSATLDLDLEVDMHLVDDGSTDGTREIMEELCACHDNISMHVNEKNLGVGRSVLEAYERLPPDNWCTVVPGDNEIVFESIKNHLSIRHDYDVILGYLQNPIIRPLVRRAASAAFMGVSRMVYGYPYRYLNGLKLYRVWAFQGIQVLSGGHGFNAELLAKAQLRNPGLRIGEAPFSARGRAQGWSKAFSGKNIARSVVELYRGYRSVSEYRETVIRGELPGQNKAERQ